MTINLKAITAIYDLVTEENISTDFEKKKTKSKLNAIKQVYIKDYKLAQVIDVLIADLLEDSNPSLEDVFEKAVDLSLYYSLKEIQEIKTSLNFSFYGSILKEAYLESILQQKDLSSITKELVRELQWKYFKPAMYYSQTEYDGLTNVADRIQYEKEQRNK
jgi:hypothetical protein